VRGPRKAKIMMVSAVCLMALAGVIFLLIVVPTMRGGATASMAQPDGEAGAGPPPPGPPPPGAEAAPGGMPGEPGGAPAGGGEEKPVLPPIEPSNTNPFAAGGVAAGGEEVTLDDLRVTRYGTNWAAVPITQRLGFPEPEVPARAAPPPPPSVIGPEKPLRVTSIMWTQDGQALAVYEYGEGKDMASGVVRPGDVVENWKVVEIRQGLIVIEDRKSGARTEIYLAEKAPEPKKPATAPAGPRGGRQPRGGQPRGGQPRPGL